MRKQYYKVKTQLDLERAFKAMSGLLDDKPKRVQFSDYTEKRSDRQNALTRSIFIDVSKETGETPEEVRGYCKLVFGVPILRRENDEFREKYDRLIRPFDYMDKIELMMEPFDFPVTRLMDTKQFTEFVDTMTRYYSEQGINLSQERGEYENTIKEDQGISAG